MFNIEIENFVLSSIILEPIVFTKYKSKFSVSLFTTEKNKLIFNLIEEFWQKEKPIEIIAIITELKKRGFDFGGYIMEIISKFSSSANIEYYIMILVELSVKRDFYTKFSHLINIVRTPETDIFEIREKAFEYFDDLFINKFIDNNKRNPAFPELIEKIEHKFRNIDNKGITGIPSSLDIINKLMGGWQNSDLTIVAGRPGMGKTAFLVQQVVDIASQNHAVGIFSLEMSAEQIAGRILTNYMDIPNYSILRKGLDMEEAERYIHLKDRLTTLKIHIDDTAGISIQDLKIKAKMMKLKYNISILLVDYLQLASFSEAKNREQEISKISQGLKNIAKELDIPVIALSQLSREVEKRVDKRPQLSDLRDSGAIEQDADQVIFLYRPEYYNIEYWESYYNNESTKNEVEIIVAKNRQGGIAPERYRVNMATSKFLNI